MLAVFPLESTRPRKAYFPQKVPSQDHRKYKERSSCRMSSVKSAPPSLDLKIRSSSRIGMILAINKVSFVNSIELANHMKVKLIN